MARRRRNGSNVYVSNAQYFREILDAWGEDVVKRGKEVLKKGAEKIAADAKANCPVKTGALRDSIHVEERSGGVRYVVVASALNSKGYDYSRIVEYHPTYGRRFMIPAYDANIDQIRANVFEAVQEAIKESNRKGGK